jgi:putative mycofactocin binding protein MftB
MGTECRYTLAAGARVREEDFGLLFFSYAGPRLYFISCGDLLRCDFFESNVTLGQWLSRHPKGKSLPDRQLSGLIKGLDQLKEKGVIVEF